jgi:Fe-S-cluster containining protein
MALSSDFITYPRTYFFDQGLRFACTQCGGCCTGDPGTVYVSAAEVARISGFLKMARSAFIHRYLYPFRDSYSIGEDDDGRCLFYADGCRIYAVRPLQCRAFPFWFSNLRSESAWKRLEKQCPGMGKGPLHTKDAILALVRLTLHL